MSYYHASPIGGITRLKPNISNHGIPLIYFSQKRENTLEANCVPFEVCTMNYNNYPEFLELRRKMMAKKIKDYYYSL